MQARRSITYTQLQTIMTETVKRGVIRSFQKDRHHTVVNVVEIIFITSLLAATWLQSEIQREVLALVKATPHDDLTVLLNQLDTCDTDTRPLYLKIRDQITKLYTEEFSSLYENDAGEVNKSRIETDIIMAIQFSDFSDIIKTFKNQTSQPSITAVSIFATAPETESSDSEETLTPKPQ